MSIDFTPKVFSRRHYLQKDESQKACVTIDPISQSLAYKFLPSSISNRLLIGNKTDHTISQCDFFHEDMTAPWFYALPDGIVLEYLPGFNYTSMTYYIMDKSYFIISTDAAAMQITGYIKIINSSATSAKTTVLFDGISVYNNINTTNEPCVHISTAGATYLTTTTRFNECRIIGVTTSTGLNHPLVEFFSKCPRMEFIDNVFIFRQSVTGGGTENRSIFLCSNLFETELTILNNKIDFEIQDNTTHRFFLFDDSSLCLAQNCPIRINGNLVTWKLIAAGTSSFATGLITSDAKNYGRDFYLTNNLFKLQKLYSVTSTIEMILFRDNASVSNYLIANNAFSCIDLLSCANIICHDIIVSSTAVVRVYDNVFETRDNAAPTYQRGGVNLRLFLSSKFGDNERSYNQFINDLTGFYYNRVTLQPSAVGVSVIWDNATNDLYYLTSSERMKKNIKPSSVKAAEIIDAIAVKEWEDIHTSKPSLSFIIEEVGGSNLPQHIKNILLHYDDEGHPISFNSEALSFLMLQNIQELNAKMNFLLKNK